MLARRAHGARARATPPGSVICSRRPACATSWWSTGSAPGHGPDRPGRSAARRRGHPAARPLGLAHRRRRASSTRTTRGSRAARSCRRARSRRRARPGRPRGWRSRPGSDAALVAHGVGGPVHDSRSGRPGHAAVGRGGRPGLARERRRQQPERVRARSTGRTRSRCPRTHRSASTTSAGALPRLARSGSRSSRGSLALVAWRRTPARAEVAEPVITMTVAETPIRGKRRAPILILVIVLRRRQVSRRARATRRTQRIASRSRSTRRRPRESHALSTAWYCPGVPDVVPERRLRRSRSRTSAPPTADAVVTVHPDDGADAIIRTVTVPKASVRTFGRATLSEQSRTPTRRAPEHREAASARRRSSSSRSRPTSSSRPGSSRTTRSAVVPCATTASADWYFAAGTTVRGVSQWLVLDDPFVDRRARRRHAAHRRRAPAAARRCTGIDVPGRSRVVIPIHDDAVRAGARRGRGARRRRPGRRVADARSSARDSGPPGVATSLGALAPSSSWWFTDGNARSPTATQCVAITNVGELDAHVNVQAHIGSKAIVHPVAADRSVRAGELGADRRLRAHAPRTASRSRTTRLRAHGAVRRAARRSSRRRSAGSTATPAPRSARRRRWARPRRRGSG